MNKWCTADLCISVKEDRPLKLQCLAAGNETDVKVSPFMLLLLTEDESNEGQVESISHSVENI